jgi:hypothetical protein
MLKNLINFKKVKQSIQSLIIQKNNSNQKQKNNSNQKQKNNN